MSRPQKVLGYYADWNTAFPPKAIDFGLYTHLNHAFALLDKDGVPTMPDPPRSRDLCTRAHARGVKVLLSVGGAESGRGFARATATPAATGRFADQLVTAAMSGGYDGVDIDLEAPTNTAERDGMNALIRALRGKLPQGDLLTMAVSATDWGGKWFLNDALLPYVDWLNVMMYDFHGPWSSHAGHDAPLFPSLADHHAECRGATVDASSNYWIHTRAWPKDRLLLGIPLYGHGFRVAKWGEPATGNFVRSDVSFRDLMTLQKQGWTRTWDDIAKVPTLRNPDGTELISYDDAESIRAKGRYARERGFGGVFFWEISQDFNGVTNPLVRAARAAFLG